MDLGISKDSEVPLREQVYAQLVLLIGTQKLKPGDALPSVRALAKRLNIRHDTVSQAYQDLAASGLVARRRGSRLVVRSPEAPSSANGHKDLDDLINDTILAARQQGYTLAQLRERVRERLLDAAPDHVLVLSTDSSFLAIMHGELEESLDCPIEGHSPAEIASDPSLLGRFNWAGDADF
jgi:GntR family transcriptional regulator